MRYANEPLAIVRVLDAGFRFYRETFLRVLRTALGGLGVIFLLQAVAELAFGVSSSDFAQSFTDAPAGSMAIDPGFLIVQVISLLLTFVTLVAITLRLHRIGSGAADAAEGVYGAALGRLPAFIGALVLYGVSVTIGLVLLVIPGIYLSILLLPMSYLTVTERLGPLAALRRSITLVRGNWWRVATMALVLTLVATVLYSGVLLLLVLINLGGGESGDWSLLMELVNTLGQALIMPLTTAVYLAVLRDLVIRVSGEDLEARLNAIQG